MIKETTLSNIKGHIVILGAGASRAAFPNGDKNGKKLPLMEDFVETLELGDLLKNIPIQSNNFEVIYSQINANSQYKNIKNEIKQRVYNYFADLSIPDEPTIYDELVLSLTNKDTIATFNWDPLLTQAYCRNCKVIKDLPTPLFLHGNVTEGYCEQCNKYGINGYECVKCGKAYQPSKLLYPITDKNYDKDKSINQQWQELKNHLKNTIILTIFGYGAPKSDKKAVEIIQLAWRSIKTAKYIEIIDIANNLSENWNKFTELDSTLENPRLEYCKKFKQSWIAKHPRQATTDYIDKFFCCNIIEDNPIPKGLNLSNLQKWFINSTN